MRPTEKIGGERAGGADGERKLLHDREGKFCPVFGK
jgi:hypothetical protein